MQVHIVTHVLSLTWHRRLGDRQNTWPTKKCHLSALQTFSSGTNGERGLTKSQLTTFTGKQLVKQTLCHSFHDTSLAQFVIQNTLLLWYDTT